MGFAFIRLCWHPVKALLLGNHSGTGTLVGESCIFPACGSVTPASHPAATGDGLGGKLEPSVHFPVRSVHASPSSTLSCVSRELGPRCREGSRFPAQPDYCSAQPAATSTALATARAQTTRNSDTRRRGETPSQHQWFCSRGCGTRQSWAQHQPWELRGLQGERTGLAMLGAATSRGFWLVPEGSIWFWRVLAGSRWLQQPHCRARLSPSVMQVGASGEKYLRKGKTQCGHEGERCV